MIYSVLRPDRKGYNRLCREMDQLQFDLESCEDPMRKAQIMDDIHEAEQAIFRTGVTSEYDA